MRILALDGDVNTCVVSVRALAKEGHKVFVGAPQKNSKAGWSRFCQGTFVYPAPQEDNEGFLRAVAAEVAREPGTFVLPQTEPTTIGLSVGREMIFRAGGRMVLPDHDCLIRAHDKHQMTPLAQSLGIDVPRSWLVRDQIEANNLSTGLPYPVVLKARTSEEILDGKIPNTSRPEYARNKAEFMEAYEEVAPLCPSGVLVQEFIEGQGSGYFALMNHGNFRAEFAHLRLREVRPTGSGSSLRVSIKPSQKLREAGRAMINALGGFHGAIMVEFKVRPDGTPVFLEVNPRLWNSLALAIYSGVNFPVLLAELAERGDVSPVLDYKAGVRCRWILGDLRHLVSVLKGKPKRYPGKFPGRLRTLWDVLMPVPGTMHDPFSWSDPMPEVGDWIHSFKRYSDRLKHGGSRPTPQVGNKPRATTAA